MNPAKAPAAEEEDDEDVDLFGSDDEEEDAEAARIREERLEEYRKKKEGKVKPAAKSVVTMDVKPWDDETDMAALEAGVRGISKDGLVWGASKLVPVGYGVRKLQINLVIEDDKVGLDDLQEEIAEIEDYVQSSDIVSLYLIFPEISLQILILDSGCHAEVVNVRLRPFRSLLPYKLKKDYRAKRCYSARWHPRLLYCQQRTIRTL